MIIPLADPVLIGLAGGINGGTFGLGEKGFDGGWLKEATGCCCCCCCNG